MSSQNTLLTRLTFIVACLAGALLLQACATKRHGRALGVSSAERKYLDCKGIEIEIDKNRGLMTDIARDSGTIDGRAVLGILGDFGIGNAMETSDAMESTRMREGQLYALARERSCDGLAPPVPTAAAARTAAAPTPSRTANPPPPSSFAALTDNTKVPAGPNCQRVYAEQFLNAAMPRAYVLTGNKADGLPTCLSRSGPNALSRAMQACGEIALKSNTAPCKPYAVDDQVVWLP